MNILLGLTGSVACIKAEALVHRLSAIGEVRVICTEPVQRFVQIDNLACKVYRDEDEWAFNTNAEHPVLHIELKIWADIYLIAPLSANTLAKIATGLADNLVTFFAQTCVARAWQLGTKRFIVAPAMNTAMWEHPTTSKQLATLQQWRIEIVAPIEKKLFCGDIGMGAMAELDQIMDQIASFEAATPE